ncbi:response regulator [Flammeovirga yaeyamensis]|uniref:Response regulator n=1 Tax=Flammeovirga yaeyamensis TaxID=367791 RepID=A0AAX1NE12_9BACT|nr:response regulator transcription factor [Flammeovirga yaeyamensis]MBB3696772.1 DNA-binding NarL/FixJ family response regulator [Flammeovirga yaeyamensis]NMF33439.1 response regulator transcription factor [Flammeovirga yaeyamensis]QWG05286.1 response regulator [Flammeovirga yaeyamensis]
MNAISISMLDDEALIVSLLTNFFEEQEEIEVLSNHTNGDDFLAQLSEENKIPQILILDLKMEGKSGVDILSILKKDYPSIKTIIMSSHYNKSLMGFMLKTGAAAFIPKGVSPKKLLQIIKEVNERGFYFEQDQLNIIREQVSSKTPVPNLSNDVVLSNREIDVLKLICYQKTAKEIGDELFITKRTVEGHKNNLFLKTETKNIAGLVIYAIQHNIVKAEDLFISLKALD